MKKKYYITGAIPYVNAAPHIGHALEIVQTNTIARYNKLLGKDVLTLCGGDENALKNVQAAEDEGVEIQKFVDKNTKLFENLAVKLNSKFDVWVKGSDKKDHYPSSQKLWNLCIKDIYKKSYEGLYCVGCETFYTLKELNKNQECPEHPGKKLEKVSEENYFFKLSKYQKKLEEIISSDIVKIIPENRKREVLAFIKGGLTDISISRSNERAKNWGVPVPGDKTQRIYVWFDALNIYQTGVGFNSNKEKYKKYWPADLHVIGKGILRFHAVYWIAFLLSANLKLPKSIFVHDYFTVNGQKMSKTLGNVVDPNKLVEEYGEDPVRYYLLAKFNPFRDGDFSEEKFITTYNADLANGLGNLVARVSKLCELSDFSSKKDISRSFHKQINKNLENYRFDLALADIWKRVGDFDKQVEVNKLWEETKKKHDVLTEIVEGIRQIAFDLSPFLPETAKNIEDSFKGPKITSSTPLFPRI